MNAETECAAGERTAEPSRPAFRERSQSYERVDRSTAMLIVAKELARQVLHRHGARDPIAPTAELKELARSDDGIRDQILGMSRLASSPRASSRECSEPEVCHPRRYQLCPRSLA